MSLGYKRWLAAYIVHGSEDIFHTIPPSTLCNCLPYPPIFPVCLPIFLSCNVAPPPLKPPWLPHLPFRVPLSLPCSLPLLHPRFLACRFVPFAFLHRSLVWSETRVCRGEQWPQAVWEGLERHHERGEVERDVFRARVGLPQEKRLVGPNLCRR